MKALPHQEVCFEYLRNRNYCINADEMGLGKTFESLMIANEFSTKVGVIHPAYLKNNWEDEIEKFVYNVDCTFVLSSYGKVKNQFEGCDLIIIDEAHFLKNPKAKRTKKIYEVIKKVRPDRLLLLTGTPMSNSVADIYSLLRLIELNPKGNSGLRVSDTFKNYYQFADHFCNKREYKVGHRRIVKYFGVKNKEFLSKLLKDKMIRRTASILNLPNLRTKNIRIDCLDETQSLELQHYYDTGVEAKGSTIKKLCSEAKAYKTAEYVNNLFYHIKGPVVIFTDHVNTCNILKEQIKDKKIKIVTGSVDTSDRDDIVNEFKKGELDVIILTFGAGSVGLNLIRASNLILSDIPYSPSVISQAIKRIHRIGQEDDCTIHIISGSKIDKRINDNVMEKVKTLKEVYSGNNFSGN